MSLSGIPGCGAALRAVSAGSPQPCAALVVVACDSRATATSRQGGWDLPQPVCAEPAAPRGSLPALAFGRSPRAAAAWGAVCDSGLLRCDAVRCGKQSYNVGPGFGGTGREGTRFWQSLCLEMRLAPQQGTGGRDAAIVVSRRWQSSPEQKGDDARLCGDSELVPASQRV